MGDHIVVLITAPSVEVARQLGHTLLKKQRAACVTINPGVESLYMWEGELQSDEEALLIIKTTASAFETLTAVVQDAHPYDVPEIIALPIVAGSQAYLRWIDEHVEPE